MPEVFDVFLSYCSADEAWVIRLKKALERDGLRVWRDKDCIRPGDLFIEEIANGVRNSRCIAIVVTRRSVESNWVREEYNRALSLAINAGKRLIGLRLDESELPDFLQIRHAVDFRDAKRFDECVRQLRWGITGAAPLPSASTGPEAAPEDDQPDWSSKPIAETVWLRGAIARTQQSRKRLWTSRIVALALGLVLGAAAAYATSGFGAWLPWLLAPGIPVTAALGAWGITLSPMRANAANIERWASFRDALEGCATDERPHPRCNAIRDRFWLEVERRTAAAAEAVIA
jgi:hypothetical protein